MDEETPIVNEEEVSIQKKEKCLWRDYRSCISNTIIILFIASICWLIYTFSNMYYDNNLTARVLAHSKNRKDCGDYEYGCCHLYNGCRVKNNHFYYDIINIDVYKIYAKDNLKSNCPSLRSIVNDYNSHYGNETCGKFGCCRSIDIGCDEANHYRLNDGDDIVNYYNNHKRVNLDIRVPKKDIEGSNCWDNLYTFKHAYEHNYPKEEDSTVENLIIVVFVVFIILGLGSL